MTTPTPLPPTGAFAAIFISMRTGSDPAEYDHWAARMDQLAAKQPGYLGMESIRDQTGRGVTISYWESEEAIANWKADAEHKQVQRLGHKRFYEDFKVIITRVERAYAFARSAEQT